MTDEQAQILHVFKELSEDEQGDLLKILNDHIKSVKLKAGKYGSSNPAVSGIGIGDTVKFKPSAVYASKRDKESGREFVIFKVERSHYWGINVINAAQGTYGKPLWPLHDDVVLVKKGEQEDINAAMEYAKSQK